MVKKIRKLFRNISSKQTVMGAIIICILLSIIATSFTGLVPQQVKAGYWSEYETQAYSDYSNYKTLTIESDYVDSTLTNFPVWVHNTSTDFANNILSSARDIAFYDSTNSTRLNHEIEIWDSVTGEIGVWVNVTSVASGADTVFYMYYNDSDTVDNRDHNPTEVWDGNYIGVFHMNETDGRDCNDSTAYDNDGRYQSNLPNRTTGYCGYGQQFVYDDGDYIDMPGGCSSAANGTIEAWVKCDGSAGGDDNQGVVYDRPGDTDYIVLALLAANDTYYFYSKDGNVYQWRLWFDASPVANKCWHHLNAGWENGAQSFLVNTSYAVGLTDGTTGYFTNGTTVGVSHTLSGQYWNGQMDEIRFSNIKRSDDWLNTTFHSQNESTNFLTFGDQVDFESESSSSYSIGGLQNNRITWTGTAGSTLWCNTTGGYYETLEINLSVNSSDNVTEIRVFIDNLNDTNEWINASNISVVFSSDNVTWNGSGDLTDINTSSFSDGGSNVSVNSSGWADSNGMYGSNPFTNGGITDTNISIYCRFKLEVPATSSATTFSTSVTDSWKIYIGHNT